MTIETAPTLPAPSRRLHKRVGPYSRRGALALLDGRSREALFMRSIRAELTAHCGGRPNAVQRRLIERAAWLSLRLAQLDQRIGEGGHSFTEHDSATYLAWSNSLTRTLARLGKAAEKPRRPDPFAHQGRSLAEIVASDNA